MQPAFELVEPEEQKPSGAIAARPSSALVGGAATPADLFRIALDGGADLERLERLMNMQIQWEAREAEKAYNVAFAAFRGEEMRVRKDTQRMAGPLAGQKYASLHAFVAATKDALAKHELGVRWDVTRDEPDWIEVTCILKHAQGHFERVSMGGPPDVGPGRNVLQARHSTVTYLERYTLKAICGLAEEGDDNDGAGGDTAEGENPLLDAGRNAAMEGMPALTQWWASLKKWERDKMQKEYGGLRREAQRIEGGGNG